MRALLAFLALAFAAAAFAQSAARPRPPGLTPLEDIPPPPPMIEVDPALDAKSTTTTRKEGDNTITEYRVGGKLYAMKVTTPLGTYHLVDDIGAGEFIRKDGLNDPVRVPQWTLWSW
jgi:hypothetical protein